MDAISRSTNNLNQSRSDFNPSSIVRAFKIKNNVLPDMPERLMV
jgi:hypothetical protein